MIQPSIPPTPAGTSLAGKTVIITGGNSGLGLEAARQFLTLKASYVIIACRSLTKGAEAVAKLKADTEVQKINPDSRVETWELDLDDYESALAFSNKVKAELKELDLLFCNGGVNFMNYHESKNGHERVMQVNCYSHFLICLELLPLLRSTAAIRGSPARITFTGSTTHTQHTLAKKWPEASKNVIGYFDSREKYQGMMRYGDSKLLIVAFVQELASRVPSNEVVVNNHCPGFVATGFDKELPAWLKPIMFVVRKALSRDVQAGGRTMIYASQVMGVESHGKFIRDNKLNPGTPWLAEPAGKDFASKLWAETVADVSKYDEKLKSFA